MVVVLEEARQSGIALFAWKGQGAVWAEGKGSVCHTAAVHAMPRRIRPDCIPRGIRCTVPGQPDFVSCLISLLTSLCLCASVELELT
jgi:hypothetical protein